MMSAARVIFAVAVSVSLCFAGDATAQPVAHAAAEVAAGRLLSERDCVACHRQKFGTPEAIYLRPDRKVNTVAALRNQVARCNAELAIQYFPEEEAQVTTYLDATYYRLAR